MKVYTSDDFTGHYPVGCGLIVVAENMNEALKKAQECCELSGLEFDGLLIEVDVSHSGFRMLSDGNY